MKLLPLAIVLPMILVACSSQKEPKLASLDDCGHVYDQMLNIALVQYLDLKHDYTPEQRQYALLLIDREFRTNGSTENFFSACLKYMNANQAECMSKSNSLDQITNCQKLLAK